MSDQERVDIASVGAVLREAQGVGWSATTTANCGKHFFAWARLALGATYRRQRRTRMSQASLWEEHYGA